jgi:hypothetical protein
VNEPIKVPLKFTLDETIDFAIKQAKQKKDMITVEKDDVLLNVYPWSTHAATKSIYLLLLKEKEIFFRQNTK